MWGFAHMWMHVPLKGLEEVLHRLIRKQKAVWQQTSPESPLTQNLITARPTAVCGARETLSKRSKFKVSKIVIHSLLFLSLVRWWISNRLKLSWVTKEMGHGLEWRPAIQYQCYQEDENYYAPFFCPWEKHLTSRTALMWPSVTFDLWRTESKCISNRWLLKRWILSFSHYVDSVYFLQSIKWNRSHYFTISTSKLLLHDLITLHVRYHLGKIC